MNKNNQREVTQASNRLGQLYSVLPLVRRGENSTDYDVILVPAELLEVLLELFNFRDQSKALLVLGPTGSLRVLSLPSCSHSLAALHPFLLQRPQ
jgi:hypothetical protein